MKKTLRWQGQVWHSLRIFKLWLDHSISLIVSLFIWPFYCGLWWWMVLPWAQVCSPTLILTSAQSFSCEEVWGSIAEVEIQMASVTLCDNWTQSQGSIKLIPQDWSSEDEGIVEIWGKWLIFLNTMAAIVALCDGSAYGADFGEEYKSGKHLDSNTEHLAELKSVVRYRSGTIAKLGTLT